MTSLRAGRRWLRAQGPPEVFHVVALVAGGVILLLMNRSQWFFGDEWDFIARRSATRLHDLFAPHNEHWSTIPLILYRVLIRTVGLDSYVPYAALVIAAHLVLAALLRMFMVQTGAHRWVATGLATLFVVLGSGFDNIIWAFQVGFVGSVALGFTVLLLVNHAGKGVTRDAVAVTVAVVALMFSGVTITMVATAAVCIALRRGVVPAVRFAAVPAAVYVAWLAAIGSQGLSSHPRTIDSILLLPQYMWQGLANSVEQTAGMDGSGPLVVLAVLAFLVAHNGFVRHPGAGAAASAVGAVLLFLIVGFGRSALGVEQSQSSRYVYIAIALLLPAFGLALTALVGAHSGRLVAVGAVLVLVLVHNLGLLRTATKVQEDLEDSIKGQVMAAAALMRSGEPVLGTPIVEPTYTPDLSAPALRRLTLEGFLPIDPYDRVDVLNAAVHLQVAVTGEVGAAAAVSEAISGATLGAATTPGCSLVRPAGPSSPQLTIRVDDDPAVVTLALPAAGDVSIALRDVSGSPSGAPRVFTLTPGRHQLTVAARNTSAVVALPPIEVEVCGLVTSA